MAMSAFVVEVPEAESLVGDLRQRFDASASLGVPAHITVLYPFMSPEQITGSVLAAAEEALKVVSSFAFTLTGVGRFAETTYLAPIPSEPFVTLTASLVARFPAFKPYGGEHAGVVPHLTVAHGDQYSADTATLELEKRIHTRSPIQARCDSVVLLENSSGRWKPMHTYRLPGA